MEESYIQNALMQFLYRELPAEETIEMTELMGVVPDIRSSFNSFLKAKAHLPKALFNPSAATLNSVLRYSAQTAISAHS